MRYPMARIGGRYGLKRRSFGTFCCATCGNTGCACNPIGRSSTFATCCTASCGALKHFGTCHEFARFGH